MADAPDWKSLPVDEVVARLGVVHAYPIKHVASLLFTYRCSLSCRHCCFNCSPHQPDRCVSFEDGVEFLRQLRQTDRVIHIAGGEAMLYYDHMLAICRAANAEGCAPHFFETNATWCTNNAVTRRRYEELREAGVQGVLISADPYHQARCPPTRRLRAYRIAVEVFGERNVAAANLTPAQLRDFVAISRDEARLREYVRRNPPCFVARAGEELAAMMPQRPIEDLADDAMWHGSPHEMPCRLELDPKTMWEIHIDPYGNIQTCCGIILGSVRERPLTEWIERGFIQDSPLVRAAYEEGPVGLLRIAEKLGYQRRHGYAQKCHLCWEVRKFLHPHFPHTFGPSEVYTRMPSA